MCRTDEPQAEGRTIRLSALRHFTYCPRSWALVEQEDAYAENLFTQRGRHAHEKVDSAEPERRAGVSYERSLPIWCDEHGLQGIADVVEFHSDGRSILPVEHKLSTRGRKRRGELLQLTGQVLCLEEMFNVTIEEACLFHHSSRRRSTIAITDELRAAVLETARLIRQARNHPKPPPAPDDNRCPRCSLLEACRPEWTGVDGEKKWTRYRERLFVPVDAEKAGGSPDRPVQDE